MPAPENSTKDSKSENSKNSNSKLNKQNNNGNQDKERTNPRFKFPNSEPQHLTLTPTQEYQHSKNPSNKQSSKPAISVKFSDKPMKINRELSQTREPKTKCPKLQNKGTCRSPQFSRQNLMLTTGIDWITFG